MMKRSLIKYACLAALLLLLVALNGCGNDRAVQQKHGQPVQISVSVLKSSLAQQITKIALEVVVDNQVIHRDTTTLNNGNFSFTGFEVPAGPATFNVRALDANNKVIYSGTSQVTIQPGRDNGVSLRLLPAVPMIKLTPYFANVFERSPFKATIEFYHIAKFHSGDFTINYNSDLIGSDSAKPSNDAWGNYEYNVSHTGTSVIISVFRSLNVESIPEDVPALLDVWFTPRAAGTAELSLVVDPIVDNQGTIAERLNNTLVLDNESVNITASTATGTISGKVTDATSGDSLPGVAIALVGAVSRSTQTDVHGNYSFSELPFGSYVLTASLSGYISNILNETLDQPTLSVNFILSQQLSGDQFRVTLNWGALPEDIDLHLWTSAQGEPFHIFYNSRGSVDTLPYAILDRDDRDGFGPETITLYQLRDTCKFAVHNYSREVFVPNPPDTIPPPELTASGAHIDIYRGSVKIGSYDVPTTGNGLWWYVFDLTTDGIVHSRNQLSDEPPVLSSPAHGRAERKAE